MNHSLCLPQKVSLFFNRLKDQHGSQLRSDLDISRREFERLSAGKPFGVERLNDILKQLNMNFGTFLYFDEPDVELASLYLKGEKPDGLPSQYLKAAYSKRRIGRIIFAILDKYFNPCISESLARTLQIGPQAMKGCHDDERVCTELYASLYSILKSQFGLTDSHLYWIGQRTAEYHEKESLGKKFLGLSREQAYQYFLDEVANYVEQSYQYELYKCNKNEVVIRKSYAPKILEMFNTKTYGNAETDMYSLGFTTTVGYFSSTCFPRAVKTACLYENDKFSEFSIDLKQLDSPSRFPSPQGLLA